MEGSERCLECGKVMLSSDELGWVREEVPPREENPEAKPLDVFDRSPVLHTNATHASQAMKNVYKVLSDTHNARTQSTNTMLGYPSFLGGGARVSTTRAALLLQKPRLLLPAHTLSTPYRTRRRRRATPQPTQPTNPQPLGQAVHCCRRKPKHQHPPCHSASWPRLPAAESSLRHTCMRCATAVPAATADTTAAAAACTGAANPRRLLLLTQCLLASARCPTLLRNS
jgi:hypothetical protein